MTTCRTRTRTQISLDSNVPNRRHPGSLRVLTAFSSISFTNSSIRSAWISAWTITANGLAFNDDMVRVTKVVEALGATKPDTPRRETANNDDRRKRFMILINPENAWFRYLVNTLYQLRKLEETTSARRSWELSECDKKIQKMPVCKEYLVLEYY